MTISFTNSATTSTSLAQSATNTISDDGKTDQLPIRAYYYFDNRFGTWMFQAGTPQTCYSETQDAQCLTPCQNTSCKPPTPPCSLGALGATVCPAIGIVGQAAGAPATCGALIVIRGTGLTGTNQVSFVPVGNTAGNSQSTAASVFQQAFGKSGGYSSFNILNPTVVSDDIVTVPVPIVLAGNYQVSVSGEGFTNVVVGTLAIQSGTCQ